MTTLHFVYLFRAKAFRKDVQPLIGPMTTGDLEPLRQRAVQVLKNPDALAFVDNVRGGAYEITHGVDDWDDGEEIRSLMTTLLFEYATPLPQSNSFNFGWHAFHHEWALLAAAGWDRRDVLQLFHGRSLCELLVPSNGAARRSDASGVHDEQWCRARYGWLAPTDLKDYWRRLALVEPSVSLATKSLQAGHYGSWKVADVAIQMKQAHEYMMRVIGAAIAAASHLLTAVES